MEAAVKKEYLLEGLICGNCAAKIARDVGGLEGVTAADINLMTGTLSVALSDGSRTDRLKDQIELVVRRHEPEVAVTDLDAMPPAEAEEEEESEKAGGLKRWARRIALIAGAALFALGVLFDFGRPYELIVFLVSYILIGGEVVLLALKNILRGRVFDENFLMSLATVGAFAIGEYPEGAAVMLFYQVGEAFQSLAVNRSRRSIAALMDIRPDYANLLAGGAVRRVAPEEVDVGALIVVRPGEKVPLDGRVVEGYSALDTSALTGEPLPRDAEPGSEVLSGSINKNGVLTVQVTKTFGESTVSKILTLVQNAGARKARAESFITKFARYYTPFVVFAALALAVLPPLFIPGASFSDWLGRALVFLVVSCPCALVISIPLSYFGGIGGASRSGILIKGANFLEALNDVDTVVFDKTGTLTQGVFSVTRTSAANGWTEAQLLDVAAHAESFSNHPIAVSIRRAYGGELRPERLSGAEELPGLGIRVTVDGRRVLAGNGRLMASEGVAWQEAGAPGSAVYVAVDGVFAGSLLISDAVKPDSAQALRDLKALGVRRTVMLTGDARAAGEAVARDLGLDAVYAELLPEQKVAQLELLDREKQKKGALVFVGDGVNDAPVLARADVGIAMGGLGSDAAIEAADVVLMTDEPSKLVTAIRLARKTRNIVWQNIVFALGVKAVILVLGALGIATMWEAVFGDVGVAVIAILNAMRMLRRVRR